MNVLQYKNDTPFNHTKLSFIERSHGYQRGLPLSRYKGQAQMDFQFMLWGKRIKSHGDTCHRATRGKVTGITQTKSFKPTLN